MRKVILVIISLVIGTTTLCGFAVDSTRSMNGDHFTAIRNAFSGGDDVATHYWLQFKGYYHPYHPMEDSVYILDERGLMDPFKANLYVMEAIWGALFKIFNLQLTIPNYENGMR